MRQGGAGLGTRVSKPQKETGAVPGRVMEEAAKVCSRKKCLLPEQRGEPGIQQTSVTDWRELIIKSFPLKIFSSCLLQVNSEA